MSKLIFPMLAAVLMLAATGCSAQEQDKDSTSATSVAKDSTSVTEVSKDSAATKKVLYVDVRTPQEFAQGSVPGAVNIPLDQVQSRIEEFRGKDEVVVFCKSGNRSGQAKAILEQNGITNVTNGGSWENVRDSRK